MEQNSKTLKKALFGFFLACLLIPALQTQLHLVKEKPLDGFAEAGAFPVISMNAFRAGTLQEKFENALKDNIGFHHFFVRSQCQLYYSLFNVPKAQSVIIGENGYLYLRYYIDAYTGYNAKGAEQIAIEMEKAKVVKAELKKKGIDLVYVFAPGKGSYCHEEIPRRFFNNSNFCNSNYNQYKLACVKNGLNLVDLRGYFMKMKDTIRYPLFSQVGVHWGEYISAMAMDTVSRYISQLRHIPMNSLRITGLEMRDTLRVSDRDAEKMLNIFSHPPRYNMPYPVISYDTSSNNVKPDVLIIGDSYFSCMAAAVPPEKLFGKCNYWLYTQRYATEPGTKYNLRNEIERKDVIIVMGTDGTLGPFPYSFIDEAYEIYAPKDAYYHAVKNREFRSFVVFTMEGIRKNKTWRKQLIQSARQKNISLLDEYINAAVWCYNEYKQTYLGPGLSGK
jgi:hypothetical protein